MTRMTSFQVARGARADAEQFNRMYLIKNVSRLRATYQIRLLAFRAVTSGLKLVLRVPERCMIDPTLAELIRATNAIISVERF